MRTLQGTVISHKMQKTVVIRIDRLKKHPKYQKQIRISKKIKAHDEKGEFRRGDIVVIEETRPRSKEKRWKVASLIKRPMSEEHAESPIL